jgi:hypothetical protein
MCDGGRDADGLEARDTEKVDMRLFAYDGARWELDRRGICVVMRGGNEGDEESVECFEVEGGEVGGGEDTTAAMFVWSAPSQQFLLFQRVTWICFADVARS